MSDHRRNDCLVPADGSVRVPVLVYEPLLVGGVTAPLHRAARGARRA